MPLIADMSASQVAEAAEAFASAQPFPHLVLDGFLTLDEPAATRAFPDPDWPHWRGYADAYQRGKSYCNDIEAIPSPLREVIAELCAPRFLARLESLTGITGLLPDPYLEGGGLHVSGPGGVLGPHTDFHLYKRLNLYRAINLLVYLNPGWSEADGGALELYASGSETPQVCVSPVFNRAVIFRTDDRSVHGFTRPVAEGRMRRSIALYYYTARESPTFSGDVTTLWRGRRHALYDALIGASRAFSRLAYMIDPNAKG